MTRIHVEPECDGSQIAEALADVIDNIADLHNVGRCYSRPAVIAATLWGCAVGIWATNLTHWLTCPTEDTTTP